MKSSNKQLVLKLQYNNSPEAFAELYDRCAPHIYRFIYFKVSSKNDAQDLTSECFLRAWAAIREKKEGVEHFRAFLYRIARNLVVDFYRKKRQITSIDDLDEELGVTNHDLERLNSKQDTDRVLETMRGLKDEYRELIIFRFLDEMSYGEIAEILGKSQVSVRVTAHRALNMLKKQLKTEKTNS